MSILDTPSSAQDICGEFRTLIYQGNVPEVGAVSGNIELENDRVWAINMPGCLPDF